VNNNKNFLGNGMANQLFDPPNPQPDNFGNNKNNINPGLQGFINQDNQMNNQ